MDLAGEIANGHGYLGYVILLVVLGVVGWSLLKARDGSPYSQGAPRLAGLLVALQWVYGIVVYVQISAWEADWLLAYVHPLAMTGAVALAGIATARAGRAETPGAAWSVIARFQGIALGLIGIGVVAAAA